MYGIWWWASNTRSQYVQGSRINVMRRGASGGEACNSLGEMAGKSVDAAAEIRVRLVQGMLLYIMSICLIALLPWR